MGGKKNSEKKKKQLEEKRKKQQAKAKKKATKNQQEVGNEEDDLEAIIKEFQQEDALRKAVTVEILENPPSIRSHFTVSPVFNANGEIIIFGGEFFDGDQSICYNQVFRLNISKFEWKQISSPNTPPPRCSHQAVTVREFIYIFGGEFSTAWQFHHYRDLWRFHTVTNVWEEVQTKTGPSPRSGHRMVHWRHYLVLFGGFFETTRGVKWFNDLYFFDLHEQRWHLAEFKTTDQTPSERSGCQFVVNTANDSIYMYGGYSKEQLTTNKQRGRNLDDMWVLHLSLPKGNDKCPTAKWEPLPNKGKPPSRRSGASSIVYKNRIILFGGVTDSESANDVEGVFYSSIYSFDMNRNRWFHLQVRQKEKSRRRRANHKRQEIVIDENEEALGTTDECSEDESPSGFLDIEDNAFYYIQDGQFVKIIADDTFKDESEALSNDTAGLRSESGGYTKPDNEIVTINGKANERGRETCVVEGKKSEEQGEKSQLTDYELNYENDEERTLLPEVERNYSKGDFKQNEMKVVSENNESVKLEVETGELKVGSNTDIQNEEGQSVISDQEGNHPEPEGRIAAGLVLNGSKLCVIWGVAEMDDIHVIFDDIWELDLGKLDEWKLICEGEWKQDLARKLSQLPTASEEGTDEEHFESGVEEFVEDAEEEEIKNLQKEIQNLREKLREGDADETPQPKEVLREFFKRTAKTWINKVLVHCSKEDREVRIQGKELRREAFKLAETHYNDLRPTLEKLDELEEQQAIEAALVQKRIRLEKIKLLGGSLKKSKKAGRT